MTIRYNLYSLVLALGVSTFPMANAQDESPPEDKADGGTPSVDEIVHKANYMAYYQAADGRADVTMTIVDQQDRERNRQFTIVRRDSAPEDADDKEFIGDQKFYVYFRRPADVNKMVFMVWKHVDSDDDRWLYLPALDLVKRIAASDKRTSFVGSHFFYEDVSGRSINADKHELVETTDTYYVLKNTPKDPESVEFAHYKMWIHKDSFIPIKTEYYDKNGTKFRVYQVLKVDTVDGRLTVTRSKMSDLRAQGHTTLKYSEVTYNAGIPDDVFTERYLRKPPRKYLR